MATRNDKVLRYIDPAIHIGVEIGPLDKPVITREMGQVYYIDHDTTEVLRDRFSDPNHNVDVNKIVDVDRVWGEKGLAELLQKEAPLDYVIASHVIEHVPDLIGWLSEVRAILKLGGTLSLVIPDKRQCFDYCRMTTRLPEVVEAYLQRSRRPSSRQIFEHISAAVTYRGSAAWSEAVDDESHLVRLHTIESAWTAAKTAFETGDYCDVHCWVFTPDSFFELLGEIASADLLKFEIAEFYETEGCEFYVSLRATNVAKATEIKQLAASLTSRAPSPSLPVESAPVLQELQFLRNRIEAMESSKFWKMREAWFKIKQQLGLLGREA